MSNSVPSFAAALVRSAADAMEAALLSIPGEMHTWRPLDKARSALDLVAECIVVNRFSAELIASTGEAWRSDGGVFDQTPRLKDAIAAIPNDMDTWLRLKSEVDETTETALAALKTSALALDKAIQSAPPDALDARIELPFGSWPLSRIVWHPLWNMTYHEGQLNYISSLIEGTFILERSR